MTNRAAFEIQDNADETFFLKFSFDDASDAPADGDITAVEMQVRASAEDEAILTTLSLEGGQIAFASSDEQEEGSVKLRATFPEGTLDPGYYVSDLRLTIAGQHRVWLDAAVIVRAGVTR